MHAAQRWQSRQLSTLARLETLAIRLSPARLPVGSYLDLAVSLAFLSTSDSSFRGSAVITGSS